MANDRKLTPVVRGPLVGGVILLLLDLDRGAIRPIFPIVRGAGVMLGAFGGKRN
jgi:hypothetical protein